MARKPNPGLLAAIMDHEGHARQQLLDAALYQVVRFYHWQRIERDRARQYAESTAMWERLAAQGAPKPGYYWSNEAGEWEVVYLDEFGFIWHTGSDEGCEADYYECFVGPLESPQD